jgi:hypothetical protein
MAGNACFVDTQGFLVVLEDKTITLSSTQGGTGDASPLSRSVRPGAYAAERTQKRARILDASYNNASGEGSTCWICGRYSEVEVRWVNGEWNCCACLSHAWLRDLFKRSEESVYQNLFGLLCRRIW